MRLWLGLGCRCIFGVLRAQQMCPVAAMLFSPTGEVQDKRLFQCGSQEAGLVKYNKYTRKK